MLQDHVHRLDTGELALEMPSGLYIVDPPPGWEPGQPLSACRNGLSALYRVHTEGDPSRTWTVRELFPRPADTPHWYTLEALRTNLLRFLRIHGDDPDLTEVLMLPVEVMDFPESGAFCVRIPRPDLAAYRSLEELAGGVTDAEALCRMALNLSSLCCQMGFYLLNLDAISRRDVLLRPEDGSLRVLHGDNVMYDSGWIPEDGNRCRAPELGTAVRRPDPCTDSWQLAAWLLLLFTGALPTAGETGTFVFGPDAPAEPPEEPLRTQRQRWDRLPPVLRQAFLDTFTRTDADSRERRTTPWAWNRLFQELPETLVPCPRCGRKTFGAGWGCLFCGAEPTPGFPE